mgnify:CR=1 FL=1
MFLPNIIARTMPQIHKKMAMHSIEQKDVLRMLGPKVATIGYKPVRKDGYIVGMGLEIGLHFDQPVVDGSLGTNPPKGDDAMFG